MLKCKKCNAKMVKVVENNNKYWVCENCGFSIKQIKRRNRKHKVETHSKEEILQILQNELKDKYNIDINEHIELSNVKDLIDSSLTLDENLEILLNYLRNLGFELSNYDKDYEQYLEQQQKELEQQYYKEQFEKRIEQIKNNNIVELGKYYDNYYKHIEAFLNNNKVNGMLIIGNSGIGKSYNLMLKLKQMGKDFVLLKTHITELNFYKFLYENKENKIIVIDDVIKILNSKGIIAILLSALDYENRFVEWSSSSPLTTDLPKKFEFNSKIFILLNEFDEKNEFLRAIKDRCIVYKLEFTKEQIIEMLYIIAKTKGYDLAIVDYIKELSEKQIINNLSLRLLDKIHSYKKFENWKKLVKDIIETNEVYNIVYELMNTGKSVKEQVKEFIEKTGLSRRTYFYIKKKIGAKVQLV